MTIDQAARYYRDGDHAGAARVCLGILRGEPGHFDALHLAGVCCVNLGQGADAVGYLLRASALRPDDVQCLTNLGGAFALVRRHDCAAAVFQRALALGGRDPGLLNNYGLALVALDRPAEAIAQFLAAGDFGPARFNLARARASGGFAREAEAGFRALAGVTDPLRAADIANELARLLMAQGRADEALDVVRSAIARHPDIGSLRWNEALALLTLGRYAEGWPAYEARWSAPNHDRPPAGFQVLDLERIDGARVLIREEQGRGDIIQCLRYLRPLALRGARISLSVYPDLAAMAGELPWVEQVVTPDHPMPAHDVVTSIMSLPLAFRTTLDTIPVEFPYLRTPAGRVARMRHHLGTGVGPRVGVAWSGSVESHARSAIPARLLAPLLQKAEFHCLQKDIRRDDLVWLAENGRIHRHDHVLRDFADTAALIDAMDLIVTVDTAVAHLAGALGKPVWILVPFDSDWRWLRDRADSPWYPAARLFRQPAHGCWNSALQAVIAAWNL